MTTTLQTFDFNENPVRAIERNDQPWFVAADVCRVLEIANHHHAVNGRPGRKNDFCLDADERGVASVTTPSGDQEMLVINESGLYALIFMSIQSIRAALGRRMASFVGKLVSGHVLTIQGNKNHRRYLFTRVHALPA